ncbi:N-acetylmuramoyl-L-alanine amidase [Terrimonas alba]|uniref:N-acetylmuramoyl-L-alanine amidase n=1 Tax=Terrimonas alba TaxID=3349636 RepID=UPI0035F36360
MKTILLYLLQVIISSGILYGYYHFFLRNKKFHQYNRYYLLSIVVLSIIVPFLQIPVYFDDTTTKPIFLKTLTTISSSGFEEDDVITTITAKESWFSFKNILSLLYIIVGVILFVRFLLALCRIVRMINIYPKEKLDNIQFIATTDPATPFSFFRWLFWNNKIEINSDNGQQIFRHELFHIRQKHSWDTIFLEAITILFWINPFFHLLKKEIKTIHEFLADKFAVEENKEWDYAELLLMQVLGSPNTRLTNPFFHNQIKRRITMLTSSKKTGYQYLRKIMVLPLAAITVTLFAFTYKNKINNKTIWSEKPITVVVDAGHGGNDPGAKSPDEKYKEAQLSLELAKAVKAVASEYNITVVLTREDDKFPGAVHDKNEALRKRVALTTEMKADAFISLHLSATPEKNQNKYSGFEAYISKNREATEDKILASAILQNLSSLYKTRTEARIRNQTGIYVLDQSSCPAILLECGFINNPEDIKFVTDKTNQEKIARSILEGIVKYKNAKTSVNPDQSQLMTDTVPKSKDDNIIFEKLEIEPSFPGGQTAWINHITKHIDTKLPIQNGAPSGNYTVFVRFVVNKEGEIIDVKPLTKHGYGMEEQVVEAIKKGPRWIPGIQNGFKVNAYRKQPFTFVIPGKKSDVTGVVKEGVKTTNEVVVVGFPKPAQTKKVIVSGIPKPTEKGEVVAIGYANHAPITVAGYPKDSSKRIEEVKVAGYGIPKPNKVKEVTVIGYPTREAVQKVKQ